MCKSSPVAALGRVLVRRPTFRTWWWAPTIFWLPAKWPWSSSGAAWSPFYAAPRPTFTKWCAAVTVTDRRGLFLLRKRDGEQSARSEEHTSELQSRGHLVCRLLLEKKKKKN